MGKINLAPALPDSFRLTLQSILMSENETLFQYNKLPAGT